MSADDLPLGLVCAAGGYAPMPGCFCRACVEVRASAEVERLQKHWADGEPEESVGPSEPVPGPEEVFARHCRQFDLPPFERQFAFAQTAMQRQWRFDFAWPEYKLAAELQGVVVRRIAGKVYTMGAHADVQGMRKDHEKLNTAIELGWNVLQFMQDDVRSKRAIRTVIRVLVARGWE